MNDCGDGRIVGAHATQVAPDRRPPSQTPRSRGPLAAKAKPLRFAKGKETERFPVWHVRVSTSLDRLVPVLATGGGGERQKGHRIEIALNSTGSCEGGT